MNDEDALLDAIAADPDALAPRLVYADWLAEREDERARFIALQHERWLARRRGGHSRMTPREYDFVREHRDAWLGPLAAVLAEPREHWELGFVEHAVLRNGLLWRELAAVSQAREWATVRALELPVSLDGELPPGWLAAPIRARLRVIRGVGSETLAALADGPPLAVESLGYQRHPIRAEPPALELPRLLVERLPAALPQLRRLELRAGALFAGETSVWFDRSPLREQLRTLVVDNASDGMTPLVWLHRALRWGPPLERLEIAERGFDIKLTRDPDGADSRWTAHLPWWNDVGRRSILEALPLLPDASLAGLSAGPWNRPLTRDDRLQVAEQRARLCDGAEPTSQTRAG